jgi:hypothetical protein
VWTINFTRMKENRVKPPSPKYLEEAYLEAGLLILCGLVLVFSGFKAAGIALIDRRGSSPALLAGYLQVMKSEGSGGPDRDYVLEMPAGRMRARDILPGLKEEFWLDSGDAVRIIPLKRKDMIIYHFPQGMDNRTRYVLGKKMNLNRATALDLSLIRGLGKVRAERIVAARQQRRGFLDWEELKGLPEVSDEIFIGLREQFFLGDPLSEELNRHVESARHPE